MMQTFMYLPRCSRGQFLTGADDIRAVAVKFLYQLAPLLENCALVEGSLVGHLAFVEAGWLCHDHQPHDAGCRSARLPLMRGKLRRQGFAHDRMRHYLLIRQRAIILWKKRTK